MAPRRCLFDGGAYNKLTSRMKRNGGAPFFAVENNLIKREIRMDYVYNTSGVCSTQIHFQIENGVLRNVRYVGGCNGNLQGLGRLTEGMDIDEVIRRLEGIRCGAKITSCPDQLAQALKQYKAQQ